jgi:two-component system, LytTR family, response regulator
MIKKTKLIDIEKQLIIDHRKLKTIDIDQIIMLRSFSNYTYFYLRDGEHRLTTRTLKHYENLLNNRGFIRVHRGFMVNKNCIVKHDSITSQLFLTNGHEVEISRRRKRISNYKMKI